MIIETFKCSKCEKEFHLDWTTHGENKPTQCPQGCKDAKLEMTGFIDFQ